MIMVTTDTVANKNIVEVKDVVTSSIVQSRNIGKDLLSGLKSIVGGELKSYTEMLEDSKTTVKSRLIQQAEQVGANAIVGLRLELSAGQGTSELIGYGTAVVVE
ncbi:MAG: YbjQ family protein [Bacillota bacterium]